MNHLLKVMLTTVSVLPAFIASDTILVNICPSANYHPLLIVGWILTCYLSYKWWVNDKEKANV
ncbi:hypothetical protein DSD26_00030 [Bacillus velezensis]|nr:hypothetical protein DSD26_00030 [Bacillus velezensis]